MPDSSFHTLPTHPACPPPCRRPRTSTWTPEASPSPASNCGGGRDSGPSRSPPASRRTRAASPAAGRPPPPACSSPSAPRGSSRTPGKLSSSRGNRRRPRARTRSGSGDAPLRGCQTTSRNASPRWPQCRPRRRRRRTGRWRGRGRATRAASRRRSQTRRGASAGSAARSRPPGAHQSSSPPPTWLAGPHGGRGAGGSGRMTA
mmetsp:Transcript_107755/g.347877  ORF Transcript_107755/g.347877 Transcript_107755/m.347877 type:complete len:203 (-) Transcript_107755:1-609(-)